MTKKELLMEERESIAMREIAEIRQTLREEVEIRKRTAEEEEARRKKATEEDEARRKKAAEEYAVKRKEFDEWLERMRELMGGMGNSNGAFAENLFFHSLEKSRTFAGVHFDIVSNSFHRTKKMPDGKKLEDQFDIVMLNDDSVAIIEVKYSSESDYPKKMIEKKVPNFRALFSDYADYKIYLGIGALSFDKYTIKEAEKYGIGLLSVSGDTVECKTDWVRAY
jgi:Holliday junction resolvase-like predicted endonuclease